MDSAENKPPILHILVIGFHHKLGCQVEFSYPPLISGTTGKNECPSGWKYLPTLALPDGSHNFLEDTVYFNLPSLTEPTESVYGVSCYRQIPVEELKIRTADMTRSTVQKSVCILARLPIYGYIEVKLSLIAETFFEQGDFSSIDLLKNAYEQLNAVLLDDATQRPLQHFYVGLSVREIMLQWRHKVLILLKLLLLQKRIICFASPVRGMCTLILSIASLIPRLLEKGFQEVACVRTSRPLSPMPDFTDSLQREAEEVRHDNDQFKNVGDIQTKVEIVTKDNENMSPTPEDSSDTISLQENLTNSDASADNHSSIFNESTVKIKEQTMNDSDQSSENTENNKIGSISREASVDALTSNLSALCTISPDLYRSPISIFASGNLCLPYLSLPYMDLLTDPSVLSYIIGTSNVLFQQKRQLADVHVDIENMCIEIHDLELRRQLMLTREDLRFIDYLMRHVQAPKEDAEGSEHWLREQFQGYLLALLRTAVLSDSCSKDMDHFNAHFIQAFKRTQCFQEWYDVRPEAEFFDLLPAGHPFAGTISVADMKLKLAQTMQNSESGRKINQAVSNTSRAVGGAISQAKGALSTWWSSITTPQIPASNTSSTSAFSLAIDNISSSDNVAQDESEVIESKSNSDGDSICSEKLTVDNVEEFEETENVETKQQHVTFKKLEGIVEIGREAEILDKPKEKSAAEQTPSNPDNGDVFIV